MTCVRILLYLLVLTAKPFVVPITAFLEPKSVTKEALFFQGTKSASEKKRFCDELACFA